MCKQTDFGVLSKPLPFATCVLPSKMLHACCYILHLKKCCCFVFYVQSHLLTCRNCRVLIFTVILFLFLWWLCVGKISEVKFRTKGKKVNCSSASCQPPSQQCQLEKLSRESNTKWADIQHVCTSFTSPKRVVLDDPHLIGLGTADLMTVEPSKLVLWNLYVRTQRQVNSTSLVIRECLVVPFFCLNDLAMFWAEQRIVEQDGELFR